MWKLLSLCLLLLTLLRPGWTKRNRCPTRASSCDECIQAGPQCAWCSQPFSSIHCQTPEALQRRGCPKSHIYNPQGEVPVVKISSRYSIYTKFNCCGPTRTSWKKNSRSWSSCSIDATAAESLVTQPQKLLVRLRAGVSRSFYVNLNLFAPRPRSQPLPFHISSPPAGVNLGIGNSLGSNMLHVEASRFQREISLSNAKFTVWVKNGWNNIFLPLQVSVEADQCHPAVHNSTQLQNRTGPWFVHITALGSSQRVTLEISVDCES